MTNEALAVVLVICSLMIILALGIYDLILDRRDTRVVAALRKEINDIRDANTILVTQNHALECEVRAIRNIHQI